MKTKLLLIFISIFTVFSIISCNNSDDDSISNNEESYIKGFINGRYVELKDVSVTKRTFNDYPDVYDFVAKNKDNPKELIEFALVDNNKLGDESVFGDLEYHINGRVYTDSYYSQMIYNVTINSNNKITGKFEGVSTGNGADDIVLFENCEFNFVNFKK